MRSVTMYFFLALTGLTFILLQPLIACLSPAYPQRVSVKQAEEVMGRHLPIPTYLPEQYEIRAVYIMEIAKQVRTVDLIISDQSISETQEPVLKVPPDKMDLQISWSIVPSFGIKLEGERFDVSEGRPGRFEGAIFRETATNNQLLWNWMPDRSPDHPEHFAFWLFADKSISKEDLVKIARSVN
jgi:hypothetical protein